MSSVQSRFRPTAGPPISLVNDGALEVIFLGVGAAFAGTMFQSNMLLIKGGTHVLIDLGTRAPTAIHEAGLDILDIENLLITHSHADHIGGVEEWCLKARYLSASVKGRARGEYRPNLLTTANHARILWDRSLRGGLEYSEETSPGNRLGLSDYVTLHLGEYIAGRGRPAYRLVAGRGADAIRLELMRTNHIPDGSTGWRTAYYSVGVLVDDRVLISGDTMFDRELLEVFGAGAETIFHDCQDFTGGVHASYEELCELPERFRRKMFLYHLPDGFQDEVDPRRDGFAGWARCFRSGAYVFD